MTRVTRRHAVLSGFAASAFAPVALAQSTDERSLTGSYTVNGRNPTGSPYEGAVAIFQEGQKIKISWSVAGQNYDGQGVRDGLVVVVDWGSEFPVVYVVMPDGSLHGTWDDGKALEKLTPL